MNFMIGFAKLTAFVDPDFFMFFCLVCFRHTSPSEKVKAFQHKHIVLEQLVLQRERAVSRSHFRGSFYAPLQQTVTCLQLIRQLSGSVWVAV